MTKGRLEAFSDGVVAIIITIMVLELKVPHGEDLAALRPLAPVFLAYVLSFLYVGIYWNNHHHLLHAVRHVDGRILWTNLHLLFWLSLFPFANHWVGETRFAAWPLVAYGFVLLMAGFAYSFLVRALVRRHGQDSVIAHAIGSDLKGNLSLVAYVIGMAFAALGFRWPSFLVYCAVALWWFIPDLRIVRALEERQEP
jgi:TMEM175 potassium channel family protein